MAPDTREALTALRDEQANQDERLLEIQMHDCIGDERLYEKVMMARRHLAKSRGWVDQALADA